MTINYLQDFPLPVEILPEKLRNLLTPVSMTANEMVEVTTRYEVDTYGDDREYVHMIMAAVPEDEVDSLSMLSEAGTGVVSSSVPAGDEKGSSREFEPSISGYDYIVASWGNNSFFSFHLSEKVWMALGLTPRCVGNDGQKVIYDDLSLPVVGVAEGEVSNEYYFTPKRNVSWRMSNEYLRRYLWLRGLVGVRIFYYEKYIETGDAIRKIIGEKKHVSLAPKEGWYEMDIMEDRGRLLLRVWATVSAVSCNQCEIPSADGLQWPDIDGEMTHRRADQNRDHDDVYLSDKFLERYEQNSFYKSTPVSIHGHWYCGPSYGGQWSFTECRRIGRNLIRVPMRELYKPKPDREILHAHAYALSRDDIAHLDLNQEHIAAKTGRFLSVYLRVGDSLAPRRSLKFSARLLLALLPV